MKGWLVDFGWELGRSVWRVAWFGEGYYHDTWFSCCCCSSSSPRQINGDMLGGVSEPSACQGCLLLDTGWLGLIGAIRSVLERQIGLALGDTHHV